MAIVFGIMIWIATILMAGIIVYGDMMQPAPSMSNQTSPLPVLIGGALIGAAVIGSHWFKIPW